VLANGIYSAALQIMLQTGFTVSSRTYALIGAATCPPNYCHSL